MAGYGDRDLGVWSKEARLARYLQPFVVNDRNERQRAALGLSAHRCKTVKEFIDGGVPANHEDTDRSPGIIPINAVTPTPASMGPKRKGKQKTKFVNYPSFSDFGGFCPPALFPSRHARVHV